MEIEQLGKLNEPAACTPSSRLLPSRPVSSLNQITERADSSFFRPCLCSSSSRRCPIPPGDRIRLAGVNVQTRVPGLAASSGQRPNDNRVRSRAHYSQLTATRCRPGIETAESEFSTSAANDHPPRSTRRLDKSSSDSWPTSPANFVTSATIRLARRWREFFPPS